jgi:hypothetical protein
MVAHNHMMPSSGVSEDSHSVLIYTKYINNYLKEKKEKDFTHVQADPALPVHRRDGGSKSLWRSACQSLSVFLL